MNVIDEETIRQELLSAADSFEVSNEATTRILSAARTSVSESPALPVVSAFTGHPRRQRFLVAAAMVLAVTAIAVPLVRAETATRTGAAFGALEKTAHSAPGLALSRAAQNSSRQPYGLSNTQNLSLTASGFAAGVHGTVTSSRTAKSSAKIESSGQVNLRVAKGQISSTLDRLSRLSTRDGGTVVSSQLQSANRSNGGFAFGTIVLEVPQPRFTELVTQVQGVGHSTYVNTSSVDVTGQYVDLSARITALEASRRQYLAIMARASSINDILAVQSQLNSLQSRIEQLQGQLQLLSHETTYGNLTVNVTEAGHANVGKSSNGVSRAFHSAVHGFVSGFEWLIRASGPTLFAVLCLIALWWFGRMAWRSVRRHSL
ncbi:MAG TPA: DUF4349 domain-containing protein [Acidimicrobiales bacterium]|nr:DUF4349 domain-containing protein [Acidimicrobiales bacterium]